MELNFENKFSISTKNGKKIILFGNNNESYSISSTTFVDFYASLLRYYYSWRKHKKDDQFYVSSINDLLALSCIFKNNCMYFYILTYSISGDREKLLLTICADEMHKFLEYIFDVYKHICDSVSIEYEVPDEED